MSGDGWFGLWVILAIPCALVTAAGTYGKTGSRVGGFVSGLFFGPIAVVVAILMPYDPLWVDELRKRRHAKENA